MPLSYNKNGSSLLEIWYFSGMTMVRGVGGIGSACPALFLQRLIPRLMCLIGGNCAAADSVTLATTVLIICWGVSSVSKARRLMVALTSRTCLRDASGPWLCSFSWAMSSSPLTFSLAVQLSQHLLSHSQATAPQQGLSGRYKDTPGSTAFAGLCWLLRTPQH